MRELPIKEELYPNGEAGHLYIEADTGVSVHDVFIDAGIGGEILIGHIADIHYNYCNQQDLDEADPVLMSTLEHRLWLANAKTVETGRRCTALLGDADQLVFNGDTLDYQSHGTMELMQKEVWDCFPDAIATVGGHEYARCMQGKVPETTTRDEREAVLRAFWKHDLDYVSRLVKDTVLVVGINNNCASFNERQLALFKADIARARENGYIVLVFAHEPICTCNPAHANITAEHEAVLMRGDMAGFPVDLCNGMTPRMRMVGSPSCDDTTNALYETMVNSADVVRGFFAGHWHNEMYLPIAAKSGDGKATVIPQYIKTASAYGQGNVMRICVR